MLSKYRLNAFSVPSSMSSNYKLYTNCEKSKEGVLKFYQRFLNYYLYIIYAFVIY